MADEDPRKFRYPMADNPKSLASLADELERYLTARSGLRDAHPTIHSAHTAKGDAELTEAMLRKAAAALRAPTIAPQIFTECKGIEELIAPLFDVRAELVRRLGRIGEILFESGFQAESPIESPLGKKR